MGDSKRTRSGIFVQGVPDEFTKAQRTALLDKIESTIGEFNGSFDQAVNNIQTAQRGPTTEEAPATSMVEREQPTWATNFPVEPPIQNQEAMEYGAEIVEPERPPEGLGTIELEEWDRAHVPKIDPQAVDIVQKQIKKDSKNAYLDAYMREAGPTLAAAATGALAGSVIPGFGTITGAAAGIIAERITNAASPKLAEALNKTMDTNLVGSGELASQIFDAGGMQIPDTPGERIAGQAGRGTTEGLGMWAGGTAMGMNTPKIAQGAVTAAPKIGQGIRTTAQNVGNTLAQAPGIQIAGETAAGAGGQAGAEIAAEKEMSPIKSLLMTIGGALIGDLTGNSLAKLEDSVSRLVRSQDMPLSEATKQVLSDYERYGDAYFSDIPATTRQGQDMQDYMKTAKGGFRDLSFKRKAQRVELIEEMGMKWGVEPHDYYARDLVEDAFAKRGAELTDLTTARQEVMDILTKTSDDIRIDLPDTPQALMDYGPSSKGLGGTSPELTAPMVEVPETKQLIEDTRDYLSKLNDSNMDSTINSLTNWEQMISDKDFTQMIRNKKSIGNFYTDPALANISTDVQKDLNKIYSSLNTELNSYVKSNVSKKNYNKWMSSNARLSEMMSDFKRTTLKQLLDAGEYNPKTMTNMLRDTDKENAEMLFNALTPEGQSRARTALISDAMDRSTKLGTLSPNQMTEELVKNYPQFSTFFDPDDMAIFEGKTRFLQLTAGDQLNLAENFDMPGSKLPGGKYALARMIFNNPLVGIPLAGATSVSSGWMLKQMETQPIRDMLLKLGSIPPNSEEAARLFKRVTEVATAAYEAEAPRKPDAISGADPGGGL